MKTTLPRTRAFSLLELLMVIAIIGVLMTILLPSLKNARNVTLRTMCQDNLRHMNVALAMYRDSFDDLFPAAKDPVSGDPMYWLWMGRGLRQAVGPFLESGINKDNPSSLFCKGDPADKNKYESTSYAYSLAFYHSPAQIDAMKSPADTYSNAKPPLPQRVRDVDHPSLKIVIGEWTSNHPTADGDNGWWNWNGARNYLFVDGRVKYLTAHELLPAHDGFPDPNLTVGGIGGKDIPF
jgi:prepilin-type N-terminal cleavage/methylation domain-containing protein/prepilin-type processing-associated H-X9-DG protein